MSILVNKLNSLEDSVTMLHVSQVDRRFLTQKPLKRGRRTPHNVTAGSSGGRFVQSRLQYRKRCVHIFLFTFLKKCFLV